MNFLDSIEDKSFISFTYDGKAIEEFGMAVVSSGDRLSTSLQQNFTNTITNISGKNGSLYWGTDITGLTINFNLATGGMTSRQLLNLKSHFKPGKIAPLVLIEHEYCYAYAIVSSATSFNFIPFDAIVKINGVEYNDTIYKGDATLSFYIPDGLFYSREGYVIGEQYTDKPWFLASGLPLTNKITAKNCFLSNNTVLNKSSLSSGNLTIYAYNAGNMPAQANVCFTKTITFSSGYSVPWNDITIGNVILGKPRMFKDVDYTISLLNSYSSSWEENKTKVLIDLRDNLDSGLREELVGIVNATGANLQWTNTTDAIAAIRNIINNEKFIFSINGIENQTLMSAELTVHAFNNPITTTTKEFVENIGDITNGKYITIKESEGLREDGTVELQAINMSEVLDDIGVFFLNTYFV